MQKKEFKKKKKKNGDRDGKELYKFMGNAVYEKNKEKLKKENRCKTCKQQKRLFKMALWTICHTKHLTMT